MERIHPALRRSLEQLNEELKIGYDALLNMERGSLRKLLSEKLGPIKALSPLEEDKLTALSPLVGVDGSNIRLGGNEPHYIELFQALAKPSKKELEPVFVHHMECPLTMGGDGVPKGSRLLGELEVEAARLALERHEPKVIMMDGGLLRYIIDAGDSFEELRKACLDRGTWLIGVVKDIKTTLVQHIFPGPLTVHDREALFGVLEPGEMLSLSHARKHENLASVFLRASKAPAAIGIDGLQEQEGQLETMARLVLALTPPSGRGVPLWLDMVDREVRLTRRESEGLLKAMLDPDIYRRFAQAERELRPR